MRDFTAASFTIYQSLSWRLAPPSKFCVAVVWNSPPSPPHPPTHTHALHASSPCQRLVSPFKCDVTMMNLLHASSVTVLKTSSTIPGWWCWLLWQLRDLCSSLLHASSVAHLTEDRSSIPGWCHHGVQPPRRFSSSFSCHSPYWRLAPPLQADVSMVCNLCISSPHASSVTHCVEDRLHRYRLMSQCATSASILFMLHLSLTVLKTGSTVMGWCHSVQPPLQFSSCLICFSPYWRLAPPSHADVIKVCNLHVKTLLNCPVTHLTEDWLRLHRWTSPCYGLTVTMATFCMLLLVPSWRQALHPSLISPCWPEFLHASLVMFVVSQMSALPPWWLTRFLFFLCHSAHLTEDFESPIQIRIACDTGPCVLWLLWKSWILPGRSIFFITAWMVLWGFTCWPSSFHTRSCVRLFSP